MQAREGAKDTDLVELREENVRTRALYEVASSDLKKAEKNIAHFRKNKQDTAKKLQNHLLGLVIDQSIIFIMPTPALV